MYFILPVEIVGEVKLKANLISNSSFQLFSDMLLFIRTLLSNSYRIYIFFDVISNDSLKFWNVNRASFSAWTTSK